MATRVMLPFLSLTLVLVACTERAADTTPSAQSAPTSPDLPVAAPKSTPAPAPAPAPSSKKDKDAVKVVARPFAWPLEQANLPTRGGTSSGAPVTLAPSPSAAWKELAGVPLGIERDRAAIKAMAGEYRTCFDFQEPCPSVLGTSSRRRISRGPLNASS